MAINIGNMPSVLLAKVRFQEELKHLFLTQLNSTSMAILCEDVEPLPVERVK